MVERAGRAMGSSYLIGVALWREGPHERRALANADVRRAITLIREHARQFPDEPEEWAWVMLRMAHPKEAARIAAALKTQELAIQRRALEAQLVLAGDPVTALRMCWVLEATGGPGEVQGILRHAWLRVGHCHLRCRERL